MTGRRIKRYHFNVDMKMEEKFREYNANDYEQCEELVNQAWKFDKIFTSKSLSDIAKIAYTKGSVLGSNYRRVVEVNGKVVGFIFGLNEQAKKKTMAKYFIWFKRHVEVNSLKK